MWPIKSRIAIVGAGPVGLTLANLLWDLGYKDITLFEKRPQYTRNQIVAINDDVYHILMPKKVVEALIKDSSCFLSIIPSLGRPQCIEKVDPTFTFWQLAARLKDIEQKMYDFIKKETRIKIVHEEFGSDASFDIIIGADGKDSVIRRKYFKQSLEYYLPKDTWYGMITFINTPKSLIQKLIIKNSKDSNFPRFPVVQQRSRVFIQKDGLLMLNIVIHKSEIEKQQEILESAMKIYGFKGNLLKKVSEQVIFPLNFYRAKSFAKDNKYYLVGDAAFNVHFFAGAGFNNGAFSALILALEPRKYNALVRYTAREAEFQSKFHWMDLNKIQERCKKYDEPELYQKIISEGLTIKKGDLDKPELCVYLNVFLIPFKERAVPIQASIKLPKKLIRHYVNIEGLLSHKFMKNICENEPVDKRFKFLYRRLIKFLYIRGGWLQGLAKERVDFKNIDKLKRPKDRHGFQYMAWLAYKDYNTKDPVAQARKRIKEMPRHNFWSIAVMCLYLNDYIKKPTFENFYKIYSTWMPLIRRNGK